MVHPCRGAIILAGGPQNWPSGAALLHFLMSDEEMPDRAHSACPSGTQHDVKHVFADAVLYTHIRVDGWPRPDTTATAPILAPHTDTRGQFVGTY